MVSLEKFQYIKQKYGHYASWAVWAEEGSKTKDNIGDLTIFDTENNRSLLQQLNPNLVVGRPGRFLLSASDQYFKWAWANTFDLMDGQFPSTVTVSCQYNVQILH